MARFFDLKEDNSSTQGTDASTSTSDAPSHLNWMGGPSYFLTDPIRTLRIAASSSFFGEPMYYQTAKADASAKSNEVTRHKATRLTDEELSNLRATLNAVDPAEWRSLTPAALMEQSIDAALAYDPESTLVEAVRLRQEEHVRTTPQVILVRAANTKAIKGSGLVTKYAPEIIRRADEPAVGLAYQLAAFGKPIPNSLKKAWAKSMMHFDSHQLAKYRGDRGSAIRAADVVSLTHVHSSAVDALMQDTLRTTGETWESIISAKGSTREAWEEAVPHMGHMALLRNLRNFVSKGIAAEIYVERLIEGVKNGKQLPFRYYSAYLAVRGLAQGRKDKASGQILAPIATQAELQPVLSALGRCLHISLVNAPFFDGRVMSLCDNSGSAWGTTTSSMGRMHIAQIANLTGVITGLRSTEGFIGVFGDRLETLPVEKEQGASVFSLVESLDVLGKTIGQATENGIWIFWDKAIREKQHWDHVFVYSDMQAGHGGLFGTDSKEYADYVWGGNKRLAAANHRAVYIDVPRLIQVYRERVNPNVMVYLVQVGGYRDTIVPEFYNRTTILGGWGDGLLRFAAEMSRLYTLEGGTPV